MAVSNVTPMLAVSDIDAACRFMSECLGFETRVRMEGYAYCASGAGAVRFIQAPPKADMDDPARQVTVYIDVDDVDALCAAHRAALEA
ncbi:MAG: VOC family protein, partial [Paracoccaceae bacterium]|nr:VOC family protein [Paracoccaceae bacterium]